MTRTAVLLDFQLIELSTRGHSKKDDERPRRLFVAARDEEWTECLADFGKFDLELQRETESQKFTLAELDEEEQSLDRLRVWFRDTRRRSVFAGTLERSAAVRLQEVAAAFDRYAERVYETVHASPQPALPRRKR